MLFLTLNLHKVPTTESWKKKPQKTPRNLDRNTKKDFGDSQNMFVIWVELPNLSEYTYYTHNVGYCYKHNKFFNYYVVKEQSSMYIDKSMKLRNL